MLPALRYIHRHPELISSYHYVNRIAECSKTYPKTLSQIDAAIASIVISGVAVYLWPDHFAGSDWDCYGVIKATALHTFSTAASTWYLEMYNTSENKNEYKKYKFEEELAELRKSYFEKKEQNIDGSSEKNLLENKLTNYEKFLSKTENESDLHKATQLLNKKRSLKKKEKFKENKAIINAELVNLYIKMLRDNPEKKERFNIWASFSDLELAIKWYKKYPAPNIIRIFRSIYEARSGKPDRHNVTTYTLVSQTIPHEPVEGNWSDHEKTMYKLVSDDSCDPPDSLIERIEAKKLKILDLVDSKTLQNEVIFTTELLIAKIQAISSGKFDQKKALKRKVFECKKNLVEHKKKQLETLICKKFGDYTPCTKENFRKKMWWGWGITAAVCYINPWDYIKLSTTNHVIVWLLNVSLQQAMHSYSYSNNNFNYKRINFLF